MGSKPKYLVHRRNELKKLYYVVLYILEEASSIEIYNYITNHNLIGKRLRMRDKRSIAHSMNFISNTRYDRKLKKWFIVDRTKEFTPRELEIYQQIVTGERIGYAYRRREKGRV